MHTHCTFAHIKRRLTANDKINKVQREREYIFSLRLFGDESDERQGGG